MKTRRALRACVVASALVWGSASAADDASPPAVLATPSEHLRRPEQTFLTFPEWYLVFSPAEYAAYLSNAERPSEFPLFSHIGQFWSSYAAVNREILKYPLNGGYHVMVIVIGGSTTIEYTLKGLYERTIGHLAESTKSVKQVPEELFAARFAQAYVDFIRVDPWYKFDFWGQLCTLWLDIPMTGPDMIRKWERRFELTTELLIKEGYARLIKLGTQSLYDVPKPVTAIVLDRAPVASIAFPEFSKLGQSGEDGAVLATVPRYEAFTKYSIWLAAQGLSFRSIAGNETDVVLSEIVPTSWKPAGPGVRVLFEQQVLTREGRKRVVLATPVANLADELRRAESDADSVVVEHVFDF